MNNELENEDCNCRVEFSENKESMKVVSWCQYCQDIILDSGYTFKEMQNLAKEMKMELD